MENQMSGRESEWFPLARFGLFIHWGLYAVPGGIWRGPGGGVCRRVVASPVSHPVCRVRGDRVRLRPGRVRRPELGARRMERGDAVPR